MGNVSLTNGLFDLKQSTFRGRTTRETGRFSRSAGSNATESSWKITMSGLQETSLPPQPPPHSGSMAGHFRSNDE